MANNTTQSPSCSTVTNNINTRSKVIANQSILLERLTSAPICKPLCRRYKCRNIEGKGIQILKTDLLCENFKIQQGSSKGKVYCSCDLCNGSGDQRRSTPSVVRAQRMYNQRSLSLPSTKSLCDIVISEDLLCVGHICRDPASSCLAMSENYAGQHCHPENPSLSYQERNLVKMKIEPEPSQSVPDEFKAHSTGTVAGPEQPNKLVDFRNLVRVGIGVSCRSDPDSAGLDLAAGLNQEDSGKSTLRDVLSNTKEGSVKFTPSFCGKIQNKKQLARSNSWNCSTKFMELHSDSTSSQDSGIKDFESDALHNKPESLSAKRLDSISVEADNGESCARRVCTCRTLHASLSLNEHEIQALEERLEQNMFVPLELLFTREGRRRERSKIAKPLFIVSELVRDECCVCLTDTLVRQRACCNTFICDECLKTYLTTMVNQRQVMMQCPKYTCEMFMSREEIAHHLDQNMHDKFYRFILEANCEPHMKTCPQCNFLTMLDKELLRKNYLLPSEARISCKRCNLEWCFPCHGPWHVGMTCKEFWKGDRLLKEWAKKRGEFGSANAHRCPKCRVFIQRSSGCDNMTCSQCGTNFCYQCGGPFIDMWYFGNHDSRYSIFGCKYRFKPEHPVERKVIRGAMFGCQLVGCVAAVCCIIPIGIVFVPPIYGSLILNRYLHRRKRRRRQKKREKEDRELGSPSVLKRYTVRHSYHIGKMEVEVSYP